MKTLRTEREIAIEAIRSMLNENDHGSTDGRLDKWNILGHTGVSRILLEITPSGVIRETEDSGNLSDNARILDICHSNSHCCNCEICRQYREFNELSMSEFIESYDEETYRYWKVTSLDSAILESDNDAYPEWKKDMVDRILENIRNIEYGYFIDEK